MADDNSIMGFMQGLSARNNNNCGDGFGYGGFGLLIILFFMMFG